MSTTGRYTMRTIARLTRFTPATLRAWEKRHGLLAPERSEGKQRLYTENDLIVLRRVRELIEEGRSIGEIARIGRESLLRQTSVPNPAPLHGSPQGPVEADDQLVRLREAMVEAACAIDQASMEQALDRTFTLFSGDVAIHQVLQPAARIIGELWQQNRCSVAGEHMASSSMGHRLRSFVETARPTGVNAPRVICACFPDENHELGLLIVAYHLGRLGYNVTYLGARLPLEDLEKACRKIQPRAVFLSVMRAPLFDIHFSHVHELVRRQPSELAFFVGGCGVTAADSPDPRIRFWSQDRPLSELDQALRALIALTPTNE